MSRIPFLLPARFRFAPPTVLAALLLAAPLSAQQGARDWVQRCDEADRGRGETFCELRELQLSATGRLEVDASPNGGITVQGWDRDEVLVQARIRTHAPEMEEARELAARVRVESSPGRVRSEGPSIRGNRGWSVSYDVFVPRRTDLDLESVNGGLRVREVAGRLELETTNGGIALEEVAGTVRAETVNGGINARLSDGSWQGEGLELETTNGGVLLELPASYSARLTASTVHGGVETDFPVTIQGRIGRRIEAELGQGGPPIRISTVNGGIRLRRR